MRTLNGACPLVSYSHTHTRSRTLSDTFLEVDLLHPTLPLPLPWSRAVQTAFPVSSTTGTSMATFGANFCDNVFSLKGRCRGEDEGTRLAQHKDEHRNRKATEEKDAQSSMAFQWRGATILRTLL
ncbi:hypothetical protein GOP47_0016430 [Adiantum capillus-veneris]|uniref:Uncharacterized protein n=1 Tax=Adiantum capillus-veneris TaxID=13818 RepID=A0A9D4UHT8_ADICA|nr:hypothetical protein GOP47_0016430 [Adiantum capillus-veneris]